MVKDNKNISKKAEKDLIKPPFYYVKKRLLSNIPAVFGLVVIVLAIIISILGYSIMPDNTPYADDSAEQIQRKGLGFTVKVLKVRKNLDIEKRNFFMAILYGQPSYYKAIPIESYRIGKKGLTIYAKVYGQGSSETPYNLIDVVKPISGDYEYREGTGKIIYQTLDGKKKIINKKKLREEFESNCLEERTYYLGTDSFGRDILSRLLFGVRISLGIGLISVVISFIVGISLGSLAGFFGGQVDDLILWFMTVVWSIPGIMLVIAISLALGKGVLVAFIAIGLTSWVEVARVVRGQIMGVKKKMYVEAARAIGMKNFRIVFVHILPNIFGPLVVILTSNFASAILIEAGLSFLGLSVSPPMASWGIMVDEGFKYIDTENGFYLVFFPSFCIALMVLAFNLLGNGLRDAYDPKTSLK